MTSSSIDHDQYAWVVHIWLLYCMYNTQDMYVSVMGEKMKCLLGGGRAKRESTYSGGYTLTLTITLAKRESTNTGGYTITLTITLVKRENTHPGGYTITLTITLAKMEITHTGGYTLTLAKTLTERERTHTGVTP